MLKLLVRELESNFNMCFWLGNTAVLNTNEVKRTDKHWKKGSIQEIIKIDEIEEHIYRKYSMKGYRG